MKAYFFTLCRDMGIIDGINELYNDLVLRYSEKHRAYHTLHHIQHCLNEFDEIRQFLFFPYSFQFALWYHDVVYDTHAADNEARSADVFSHSMRLHSLPETFTREVQELILATKIGGWYEHPDTPYLLDIDLSIFGQLEGTFDRYEQEIRQEYDWVSEEEFIKRRAAILQSFYTRPQIYLTHDFRNKYEQQARRNLERSLERLKGNHHAHIG